MKISKRFWPSSVLAIAVGLPACTAPNPTGAGGAGGSPPVPETPTYYRDVKVIIDANCTGCHKAGGVAPMPFENAEQVQPFASAMSYAVEHRHMPPWMASPGCNEYEPDRSLSDRQIQIIRRWAEQGAPIGDPRDEPAPTPRPNSEMSRVDLRLSMPAAYTPRVRADDYRCFVLNWTPTARKYITGIGVTPGVAPLVHHAIAYLIPPASAGFVRFADVLDPGPGYACPGGVTGGWITSWEPGGHGIDFPHGTGIAVEPGSVIVLQVHYNTLFATPSPDQSSVEFALADTTLTPARTLTWMNLDWWAGNMPIPANDPDVTHVYETTPSELNATGSMRIHWADIHMHTLG
ncbi:MAG TPA: monooxygenase, partial [Polyangiaceae bacterium]|nr:monooxygenase [Polyangiaceae bacterium]